jgi:hypothetical protein
MARKVPTETPKSTSHRWISAVILVPITQTQLPAHLDASDSNLWWFGKFKTIRQETAALSTGEKPSLGQDRRPQSIILCWPSQRGWRRERDNQHSG